VSVIHAGSITREEFLAECIESVLAQTYQNWDYTIVNNRSTDRQRLKSRKVTRPKIRGYEFTTIAISCDHSEPQTTPSARFPRESKYCKVVLADDWLFPSADENGNSAEAHPTVGFVRGYGLHGDGRSMSWRGLPSQNDCERQGSFALAAAAGRYVFGAPTATLVRSDFVRKEN